MKRNILITLLFCTVCLHLSAFARGDELDRLSEALGSGGISGIMTYVNEKGVSPPSIPSRWNVENRTRDDTERREKTRIRALGFALAESVEKTVEDQRELKADETLYRLVETLCDFADWCAETPGWGNQILANYSLEQVAAISTRLMANTNFPIEKCERIVARISPEWLGPRGRAAALNAESGTNIFNLAMVDSNEELDMACGAGWFLMTFEGKKIPEGFHIPPNKSLNISVAKSNLDFFVDAPRSPNGKSPRLSWDYRSFGSFRYGFGWDVYRRAEGLFQFRKTLGGFPRKFMRSPEEEVHLKSRIKLAEKFGTRVIRVEDEPDYDPLREGFNQAWDNRPNRDISQHRVASLAFEGYKKVISGEYSPNDIRDE